MATLLLPTTELVVCGWLVAAVPGFSAGMVGTALPQDPSKWMSTGFVQVGPVVGGTPDPYTPMRSPVVSVHCWGVNGTQPLPDGPINLSNKPPWNRTAQLAEQIRAATVTQLYANGIRQVAMPPAGYAHAYVHTAYLLTEPRRMLGDAAGYAHHQFDLYLSWTPETV